MIVRGMVLNERYEVIKSIGEGGMANVYLAFDKILERKVAIKMLRGDLSNDELFIRRFKREALAATALNHPNIVQIYDIGEEDDKYYIVMEYVEGITLKQLLLKRKRLSVPEVVDISKQLTLAISHAHSKNIVHRDIKPHNILILKDGTIKITDFGIAVTLNATLLTQTNSIMGSVHYLPPEQISGNIANNRSDIYSIGILMYELLTGELPFNGESAVTVALMHVRDKFPSPREIDERIPQSVENIVIRATAKNPKNRYATADDMQQELSKCLSIKSVPKLILDDKMESETMSNLLNNSADIENVVVNEKKGGQRKKLIITLVALLLLLLSSLYFIPKITTVEEIKVPDVVGLSRSEATKNLIKDGFKVSDEVKFVYSDSVPNDHVISSSPKAGVSKPKGFTIILTVSKGKEDIALKSYVGTNVNDARAELEAQNFIVIVGEKDIPGSTLGPDIVAEQNPIAGTKLEAGSVITLYTVKQNKYYPDMVNEGYSQTLASAFCSDNGIKCNFKSEFNDSVSVDKVVSQSIEAGKIISEGDILEIVISLGPKQSTTGPQTP